MKAAQPSGLARGTTTVLLMLYLDEMRCVDVGRPAQPGLRCGAGDLRQDGDHQDTTRNYQRESSTELDGVQNATGRFPRPDLDRPS